MWTLKGTEVKKIFDPVVADIKKLVDGQLYQIPRNVKAIFLVGGLGANSYLHSELQKRFPDLEVIQPRDAWPAVLRGAVLSELRREPWLKFWDESRGYYRVEKMTWYVNRTENLHGKHRQIRFPFLRILPESYNESDLVFTDKLIQSDEEKAHIYPSPSTQTNCVLTTDLRGVDKSLFKIITGVDGKLYVAIHYDLVVTINSGVKKFSLEIGGNEIGSVKAKYD